MHTSFRLRNFLRSSVAGLLAVAAIVVPSLAHAQLCTITASAATYTIPAASHYDATPTSNFTGVGTGDYVFEDGWWFRVAGDAQEFFFPAPTSTTCAGAAGTIAWADVSARGLFSATNTLALASAGAGTGELVLTMSITNLSAVTPLTISLFHGVDFDVNGSAGTDNATLLNPNDRMRITDTTAGFAEYGTNPSANAFLVRPFAAATDVFGLLGDGAINNFDNTGLPATSFDFTGAFQWDLVIPPSGTTAVSALLYGNTVLPPLGMTVAPIAAIAPTTLTAGTGTVTPTITTPAQNGGSTQFDCSIPPSAPSNFLITSNASQTLTTAAPLDIGLSCVPQAAVTTATLTCTQTATPGPNPPDATATITCPAATASVAAGTLSGTTVTLPGYSLPTSSSQSTLSFTASGNSAVLNCTATGAGFSVTPNPLNLAIGVPGIVTVTYTGSTVGTFTGNLDCTTTGSGGPFSYPLSVTVGAAIGPAIAVPTLSVAGILMLVLGALGMGLWGSARVSAIKS